MINKLSRKDIKMLESSINNGASTSKNALKEYLDARKKAETAWKVFRDSLVLSETIVEEDVENKESRKFKTGDKVRVLSTDDALATAGLGIGDIAEVSKYALTDNIVILKSPHQTGYAYFDESSLELVEEKSANELRAEIIRRAKEFIENTKTRVFTGRVRTGLGLPGEGQRNTYYDAYVFGGEFKKICNVEFIVHQEKHTVVALMRGIETKKVYSKGIAKCHPDDVFNEHIGKAIALGRALGKDVSEFENAVQPTEPVVGHKLSNELEEGIDKVTAVLGVRMFVNNTGGFWNKDTLTKGVTKIIDDTNAQYEGGMN